MVADPLTVFFTPESFAAIRVPVQLWQSERGGDGVSPESVAVVDKNLPTKHEYHVVPNSGHFAFLTPCPPGMAAAPPELCTDAPGFDRVAFHKELDAECSPSCGSILPEPIDPKATPSTWPVVSALPRSRSPA